MEARALHRRYGRATGVIKRFRVGSRVVMSDDALDNYGEEYRDRVFRVASVSTKYMPSARFFSEGKPAGYHPGFDEAAGSALYDFDDLNFSLYDRELEPAPARGSR